MHRPNDPAAYARKVLVDRRRSLPRRAGVAVPAGWTDLRGSRRIITPASGIGSGVALRPMPRTQDT